MNFPYFVNRAHRGWGWCKFIMPPKPKFLKFEYLKFKIEKQMTFIPLTGSNNLIIRFLC